MCITKRVYFYIGDFLHFCSVIVVVESITGHFERLLHASHFPSLALFVIPLHIPMEEIFILG